MKFVKYCIFISSLLLSWEVMAQTGLYPLTIIAKDERAGSQFNAKYNVKSTKTNQDAKVEYKDGFAIAYLVTGEKYKIDANAEGYAPKSETITIELDADPKDARIKNIIMKPTVSAHVMVKAIDDKTEEAIPADFVLRTVTSKKEFKESTTKEILEKRVVVGSEVANTMPSVTQKEEVEVFATATNYSPGVEKLTIEIKDPPQKYQTVVRLKKSDFKIRIQVVDNRDLPIRKTKIVIREVGAVNPTISQLDPPNSEIATTLKPDKSYRLSIEAPGYTLYEKTFVGQEAVPDWKIRLMPKFEAYYKIKAMDNNKRVPVNIKISSTKQGVIAEMPDTDTTSNIKITEQGIFKVEITAKGYQPLIEDIYVEGTDAGKTNIKIVRLEKGIKEYVLKLVDDAQNKALSFGDVKVKTAVGLMVKATKNIQSNDWTVVLEEGSQYVVEASAPDYKSVKENVKQGAGKVIEIKMSKMASSINLTAIDALTKKPIAAQFKLIRSEAANIEGKIKADGSRFKVELIPGQAYKIDVSSEGYNGYSGEISLNSDGKTDVKTYELTKDNYAFQFKIMDVETNKVVPNAILKAVDANGKDLGIKFEQKNGELETELKIADKYVFEIVAEGYDRKNVSFNPAESAVQGFKKEIPISKKPLDLYKIQLVDSETKEPLTGAELRVLVDAKQIEVTKAEKEDAWTIAWNDKLKYEIDAKLTDYEPTRQILIKPLNSFVLNLPMRKIPKKELVINAYEAFSKKPIDVTFKLTTDLLPATTSKGKILRLQYAKERTFTIEATADGYEKGKLNLSTMNMEPGPFEIKLQREKYPFTFKAVDINSKVVLEQAKIIVKNLTQSGDKIKSTESKKGELNVDLKPEYTYELVAEAKGYDAAIIKVDVAMFVSGNFFVDVPMSLRKEPLPAVVKREDPPKEIPKPVEKPKEIVKPKKTEDFTDLAVGKVIMLDNVLFDQGSYELREDSKPQLDKLLATLKTNPKLKIEVIGHTSNEGDPRLNLSLSKFRAKVIANYLFNRGIEESRILSTGFGSEKPIVTNGSDDEKKQNRRVEVVVKEF